MTADCLPVLFCDRAGTRVAAAHAGWRGLAAGVLEATLDSLAVPPAEVLVWLGPAIGPQAFEVGPEVRETFVQQLPQAAEAFVPSQNAGKFMADIYHAGAFASGGPRCHGCLWRRFLHRDRSSLLFLPPCAPRTGRVSPPLDLARHTL